MLVPDQPRALREMVRVTKPGGRVLLIAYGSPAELEFLHLFIAALKAVAPEFPGVPDDPPPLEFQVADPEVLRQRLTDAGLKDVRVERTAERPASPPARRCGTGSITATRSPGCSSGTSPRQQRDTMRQVLDGMLRERAGGNGKAVLDERCTHRHRHQVERQKHDDPERLRSVIANYHAMTDPAMTAAAQPLAYSSADRDSNSKPTKRSSPITQAS